MGLGPGDAGRISIGPAHIAPPEAHYGHPRAGHYYDPIVILFMLTPGPGP
jgi:hypothetical protein